MSHPCENKWVIWPETDGLEQRCECCGAFRTTPIEDRFWLKAPGERWPHRDVRTPLNAVLGIDYGATEARVVARCGVVTTEHVRPDHVAPGRYGHWHAYKPANGLRLWVFADEVGRDLFAMEHAEHVRRGP